MTTHTDCSMSLLLKGCVQSFESPSFNIEEEKDLSVKTNKQTKNTNIWSEKSRGSQLYFSVVILYLAT